MCTVRPCVVLRRIRKCSVTFTDAVSKAECRPSCSMEMFADKNEFLHPHVIALQRLQRPPPFGREEGQRGAEETLGSCLLRSRISACVCLKDHALKKETLSVGSFRPLDAEM